MKILLGQLNSNGDCLFATVIARQIKQVDYPHCHLTWAVNSKCRQSVELNPYVDEIWEIPTAAALTTQAEWDNFIQQVENRKSQGDFDLFFPTQIIGEQWINYDGGVRSSIYANYPHPITVSHQPVLRLSNEEVSNVRRFAERHQLAKYRRVVLIECGPDSFDASLNPQSAYALAVKLSQTDSQTAFVLSSNKPIASSRANIIDGSEISFRENAELTKHCDLLIGCGSGISWLATSEWAKPLPMILIVNDHHPILPSMSYDHQFLGLPTDHIIEITDGARTIRRLEACLNKIRDKGFAHARRQFNETIKLADYSELKKQLRASFIESDLKGVFFCLQRYLKRNGLRMFFTEQFGDVLRYLLTLVVNKIIRAFGFGKHQIDIKK